MRSPRWRRDRAALTTLVLVILNALRGPVLASDFTAVQGNALDETVIALLIGAVVGVLISTVRFPGRTNTSATQKSQRVDADR